jgi:hypothetical protein
MIDSSWPEDRSCTYSLIRFCLKYCMPPCEQMLTVKFTQQQDSCGQIPHGKPVKGNDSLVLAVGL